MSVVARPVPAPHGPRGRPARRAPAPVLRYSTDALLAFVAMAGLTVQPLLGSLGALVFLASGAAICALRLDRTLASLLRMWPFVAVALWVLLSSLWSAYPSLSLRGGLQLMLTVIFGAAIVTRISAATFVKLVFVMASFEGAASLLIGRARADGGGYLGIFASKNALAGAMSGLMIVSMALMLDRRLSAGWRLAGLAGLVLGSILMVMGNSAGALVTNLLVVLFLGMILLLRRLPVWVRLTAMVLGLLGAILAGLIAYGLSDQLAAAFLNATGKDVTLTGRTDLWQVALRLIAERPLLGIGFQGFWVHGNPGAEELWAQFGIESRSGFHFHNTPISNAVEIGIIGVVLETVPLVVAGVACFGWVLASRSAEAIFLCLTMMRLALLMWVEVVFFYQFAVSTIVMMGAYHYGRAFLAQRRHAQRPPLWQGAMR